MSNTLYGVPDGGYYQLSGVVSNTSKFAPSSRTHTYTTPNWSPLQMIMVRLAGVGAPVGGYKHDFQFLSAHIGSDKAFVFIVHNEQAVTLEDDRGLFPSDRLITQLRTLMK